jgi:uncharacterized protein
MAVRTSDMSKQPEHHVPDWRARALRCCSCLVMPMVAVMVIAHLGAPHAIAQQATPPQSFQAQPRAPNAGMPQSGRAPVFKSPEAAFEQGMGSWRGGFVEQAIPALRYAADHDVFLAQYYLARIFADSSTPYTDHAAAYQLYKKIALDHANVDPDDDQRAAFVARSLTALAGYVRTGLPQIGVRPDTARAVEYLRHAAQFFNDEEAQYDLAKIFLQGDGVPADPRAGLHYLSALTQRGHAGAQALLAEIYWRGRYGIKRDEQRAFALVTVAVENAPDAERVWIEDMYHKIYCGMATGTRSQTESLVADWRQRFGRTVNSTPRYGLGMLPPQAQRTCRNGDLVPPPPPSRSHLTNPPAPQGVPANMLDGGGTRR